MNLETLSFIMHAIHESLGSFGSHMDEIDPELMDEQDVLALSSYMEAGVKLGDHFCRRAADYYMQTYGEIPPEVQALIDRINKLKTEER